MERYIVDSEKLRSKELTLPLSVGLELFEAMENSEFEDAKFEFELRICNANQHTTNIAIAGAGYVVTPCDRCLDPLKVDLTPQSDMVVHFDENDLKPFDGLQTTIGPRDSLSLVQFIYDTIILSMPAIRTHQKEECNPAMLAYISNSDEEELETEEFEGQELD